MAMSADKTFWGFLFWLKYNPYTSIEELTWPDLFELAKQFAAVNATAQTITPSTPAKEANPLYDGFGIVDFSTDIQFPKKGSATRYAADAAGLATSTTLALNKAICEQSMYPARPVVS